MLDDLRQFGQAHLQRVRTNPTYEEVMNFKSSNQKKFKNVYEYFVIEHCKR